ncbi:hypothetical protein G6O67_000526 [Ophiocordyceps sinensis]|uniref:Uncharacterized protein n=1 Tax=Ophiocordyceps sinensis TaxID=72228 RepID=A0A8H4V9T8_9HYPO|nr:hypothetical protein G6O67_000526 [Ophiocordyceps sinensis]
MEQVLDQPDFSRVAHDLRDAADHFERCGNLPAVDGGARLMQRMDAILEQLTLLNRKVDGLDRRMTVAERNGVARMENSSAMRPDAGLAPLFSLQTGDEIPGCPSTMEEAGALPARDVDRILRQLGASTVGSVQDRRRRLLLAFGVAIRAV